MSPEDIIAHYQTMAASSASLLSLVNQQNVSYVSRHHKPGVTAESIIATG